MYLSEDGIGATIAFLAGTAPGSRLDFTYLPVSELERSVCAERVSG